MLIVHVPAPFERELDQLVRSVLTMARHAETAVERAIKALVERDEAGARQAKEDDRVLDRFEIEVDELAVRLIAEVPKPGDLLLITIAMKISHDLERVGDEATTIARRAIELNQEPLLKP